MVQDTMFMRSKVVHMGRGTQGSKGAEARMVCNDYLTRQASNQPRVYFSYAIQ